MSSLFRLRLPLSSHISLSLPRLSLSRVSRFSPIRIRCHFLSHFSRSFSHSPAPVSKPIAVASLPTLKQNEIDELIASAKRGDAESNYLVGLLHFDGKNPLVAKNYHSALLHFTAAAVSPSPHASALRQLGIFYFAGYGIPKNQKLGREMFHKSAALGDSESNFLIGNIYRNGAAGENKNIREAMKFYRKAAETGHIKAKFVLAQILMSGEGGISVSHSESLEFALAAAESHPEAAYLASKLLQTRFESNKLANSADSALSRDFLRRSAELKFRPAQLEFGLLMLEMNNHSEAEYWLGTAANDGCVKSQEKLGFHLLNQEYTHNKTDSESRRRALQFLSNAAESGSPAPQLQLAALAMMTDHTKKSQTASSYIEKLSEYVEKNSTEFTSGIGLTLLKLRVQPELLIEKIKYYELNENNSNYWNGNIIKTLNSIHKNMENINK